MKTIYANKIVELRVHVDREDRHTKRQRKNKSRIWISARSVDKFGEQEENESAELGDMRYVHCASHSVSFGNLRSSGSSPEPRTPGRGSMSNLQISDKPSHVYCLYLWAANNH